MKSRRKGYFSSPGFWVAALVGGTALFYAITKRATVTVIRPTVTIGPAVIDGYGGA